MTDSSSNIFNPEQWVDKYGDSLFAWAYHRTGNKALAEDLVQETFLSTMDAGENFKGTSTEKTWLFAICNNTKSNESFDEYIDDVVHESHRAYRKKIFVLESRPDNAFRKISKKISENIKQLL